MLETFSPERPYYLYGTCPRGQNWWLCEHTLRYNVIPALRLVLDEQITPVCPDCGLVMRYIGKGGDKSSVAPWEAKDREQQT